MNKGLIEKQIYFIEDKGLAKKRYRFCQVIKV
jgi:hypothetical protein